MGQAEAEGENLAIEAVIGALDSPLLNDNDITGAKQVLLKIVTGQGEGEIRMSELSKIKNKIQEAAGRNVNIIEGIGIDADLGNAVSVTIIATGFEQKKKPKVPKTIILGDDKDLDVIKEEDSILDLSENNQQSLDLDERFDDVSEETLISIPKDEQGTMQEIESVENHVAEKIVLDLELDKDSDSVQQEEISEDELLTSILSEDDIETESVSNMNLDLKNEDIVEETLNTIENNEVNTDSMKIEARERENRLRSISQQLRTPSGLTNLEDVPAYQRNNIELDDQTHSSEDQTSTYTLDEVENNTNEIRKNNSFLHDNVD